MFASRELSLESVQWASHCGILPLNRQEFNATGLVQYRKGWVLGYLVALIPTNFLFLDEAINVTPLLHLFLGVSESEEKKRLNLFLKGIVLKGIDY